MRVTTRFSVFLLLPLLIGLAGAAATAIAININLPGLGWAGLAIVLASLVFVVVNLVLQVLLPLRKITDLKGIQEIGLLDGLVSGITQLALGNFTAHINPASSQKQKPSRDVFGINALCESMDKKIQEGLEDYSNITSDPIQRLCFVGDNSYQEGVIGARETAKLLNKRGNVGVILPRYSDANHSFRVKGFVNTLAKEFPQIKIVGIAENLLNNEMRDNSVAIVSNWLKTQPDLDCIFLTEGWTPIVCAETIAKHTGKKPKIVAFDVWEDNMRGMDMGIIQVLLDQDFYSQGYLPVINVYNYLECQVKPVFPKITLEPVVVTPQNRDRYWNSAQKSRPSNPETLARLPKPLPRRGNQKIKIGFLIPEIAQLYATINEGALAAAALLQSMGVSVEIIDISKNLHGHPQASVGHVNPYMQDLKKRGFNAIIMVVNDKALIQAINQLADSGIVFATFNSEPFNLREIIITIFSGLSTLAMHSETLAAAANESSRSTDLINTTMQDIAQDAQRQTTEVQRTDKLMLNLSNTIQEAANSIESVSVSIDQAAENARHGGAMMTQSADTARRQMENYTILEKQVRDLQDKINQIGSIVQTIEEFASETNVLAINAAIQAARAGEQGKGFSVVANAVRTLSESSQKAAVDIKGIVQKAQNSMEQAASLVGDGVNTMNHNLDLSQQAQQALDNLAQVNQGVHDQMKIINAWISTMRVASGEVREAMATLEGIIEHNGARLIEISGSTLEMSQQENDLSKTAADLLGLSRDQEILLTQLTVQKSKK